MSIVFERLSPLAKQAAGMLTPGIKSKPIYLPLVPDPAGSYHLLVGEGRGGEALIRLLRALKVGRSSLTIHYARGSAGDEDLSEEIARLGVGRTERYASVDALFSELPGVLDRCAMGTRLYAAGSEAFLWRATAVGRSFGMGDDEIQCELCGSAARRVYCVHCKAFTDHVRTNVVACAGCGMTLFVRDHFSRRLAAYMGVKADAEVPGNIPGCEVLYS